MSPGSDGCARSATGSVKEKLLPSPGVLTTDTRPPWASTRARTM
jgi:hypothetical protein